MPLAGSRQNPMKAGNNSTTWLFISRHIRGIVFLIEGVEGVEGVGGDFLQWIGSV